MAGWGWYMTKWNAAGWAWSQRFEARRNSEGNPGLTDAPVTRASFGQFLLIPTRGAKKADRDDATTQNAAMAITPVCQL